MQDRVKLPLTFDSRRLQADLEVVMSEPWIPHFVAQNYQGDWSVIPLRGASGATHPIMQIYSDPCCEDFADTPYLAACEYFQEVLATFKCELQAIRLMKLGAGSTILEHQDYDLDHAHGVVRLHIVIITNDQVTFRLNGSTVPMAPGDCYYLRLSDPHSVENAGQEARVHMVIDALCNDWLDALIRAENE
jgi:hypothetical protein